MRALQVPPHSRVPSRTAVDEWETPADASAWGGVEDLEPTQWVTQIEDLDTAAVSGQRLHLDFGPVLRTHQALALLAWLEREDVAVQWLSLHLSASVAPAVLTALLAAVDGRVGLEGFELRLDGPPDEAQRLALARSQASLRLSADTVRSLLFGELLSHFEALPQPSPRLLSEMSVWRDFVHGALLRQPGEEPSLREQGALAAWLRRTRDEALMWALATLLPAGTLLFTSLPDRHTTQMLAQAQLPYALSHSLLGARGLRQLCNWLARRAGPALQAIDLCVLQRPGETALIRLHNLLMQRVQQGRLRALSLRLECDEGLGDLHGLVPGPYTQNRLETLSLDLQGSEISDSLLSACARLMAFLKPQQLALAVISVGNAVSVVEATKDRPCLPLDILCTGWANSRGRSKTLQWLRRLLDGFRGPGTVLLCAPEALAPDHIEAVDASARVNGLVTGYEVLLGVQLLPGLRPGRAGLLDELPPEQRWRYHRFNGTLSERRQRLAAQALVQIKLPGAGRALPVELAQHTLASGRLRTADLRAMASVSHHARSVGSAQAIAEHLIRGRLTVAALCDLLTDPRGALDSALADALDQVLVQQGSAATRALGLLQAARSAF